MIYDQKIEYTETPLASESGKNLEEDHALLQKQSDEAISWLDRINAASEVREGNMVITGPYSHSMWAVKNRRQDIDWIRKAPNVIGKSIECSFGFLDKIKKWELAWALISLGGPGTVSAVLGEPLFAGFCFLMLAGACVGNDDIWPSPDQKFARAQELAEKMTEWRWTPRERSKLFKAFAPASRATFKLEKAAHFYKEHGPGNKAGKRLLEKGLKDAPLPDGIKASLREEYNLAGGFPAPGTFLRALNNNRMVLENKTNTEIIQIVSKRGYVPSPA